MAVLANFFGSSEPRSRCATFLQPRPTMVRPPAAAIRHLLVFGCPGDLKKFCRPFGASNGPKTPKSGFSQSWGPFWTKHPPTKFDRMLNTDPLNPVWGPRCPWGLGYGRFFLGGGLVGDRFCRLGTQLTKTVLAITRSHQRVFWFFWLIRTVFALRNFFLAFRRMGSTHLSSRLNKKP